MWHPAWSTINTTHKLLAQVVLKTHGLGSGDTASISPQAFLAHVTVT